LDATSDERHVAVAAERSRLQVACASTLIWRQRYRQCVSWCERALPHALSAADRATEAHAYYLLDWAFGELGDTAALQYRELAQPIYEELGDFSGLASVLNNRGVDALVAGRWDESCAFFEQSRDARRRAGDVVGMAQCGHNLAEVRTEQGRFDEAESYLREARRIWRASGYAMGVAAATNTLGRTLARSGQAEEGVELLRDARQRFVALAHGPFLAETEGRLAEALVFAGRPHDAIAVLDELGHRAAEGGPPVAALAIRIRGTATAMLGDNERARLLLDEARATAEAGDVAWESALAAIQAAQLTGTDSADREQLEGAANEVLTRMGIDARAVIPAYSLGS
jgi:tetratricopeptide (TPR) repeat protein